MSVGNSVISQVELENKKVKQLLEIYEKVIFVYVLQF